MPDPDEMTYEPPWHGPYGDAMGGYKWVTCLRCGATVIDHTDVMDTHEAWHQRLEDAGLIEPD